MTDKPGSAYGFFETELSFPQFQGELGRVRTSMDLPPNLQLRFIPNLRTFTFDNHELELERVFERARADKYSHGLYAVLNGASNEAVAGNLSRLLKDARTAGLIRHVNAFEEVVMFDDGHGYCSFE